MATIPDDLIGFLNEHRDSREYRRALAVKLVYQGYTYETISEMLDVTPGFVSQAKKAYTTDGVQGLTLKYSGSQPLLTTDQRAAVLEWLKQQSAWSLERLRTHLEQTYAVVFKSDQSYYELDFISIKVLVSTAKVEHESYVANSQFPRPYHAHRL